MDTATRVQILNEAFCISRSTNNHEKCIQLFSFQLYINSRADLAL